MTNLDKRMRQNWTMFCPMYSVTICDCGQTTIISLENSLFFPMLIKTRHKFTKFMQKSNSSKKSWKTILSRNLKKEDSYHDYWTLEKQEKKVPQYSPLTQHTKDRYQNKSHTEVGVTSSHSLNSIHEVA